MNSFRMDTASSDLHTRYTKEREEREGDYGNKLEPDMGPTFGPSLSWEVVELHGANGLHHILHQLHTAVQSLVSEGTLQSEINQKSNQYTINTF